MNRAPPWVMLAFLGLSACGSTGSAWVTESAQEPKSEITLGDLDLPEQSKTSPVGKAKHAHRIVEETEEAQAPAAVARRVAVAASEGRVVGTFRNTYYHFPTEAEFSGEMAPLYNAQCETIKSVPRAFHDAVCVQGSGLLSSGVTVSFAKRDCSCALECPRTNQHICFDTLDKERFPWGRGATGKAITPLLTVAVDSDVIPLHTPIYIPEYAGVPRDAAQSSLHDGCFVAQDRGLRVKGRHIDVFTGDMATANLWNRLLPSNQGVTVVIDSPRCRR